MRIPLLLTKSDVVPWLLVLSPSISVTKASVIVSFQPNVFFVSYYILLSDKAGAFRSCTVFGVPFLELPLLDKGASTTLTTLEYGTYRGNALPKKVE